LRSDVREGRHDGNRSRLAAFPDRDYPALTGLIELSEDKGLVSAREAMAAVRDPVTAFEELLLRGLLLEVAMLWAVASHRRTHGGAVPTCGFRDEVILRDVWQRRAGGILPAKKAFVFWATQHFRALDRAHPPPAHAAAAWITAHSRERVTDKVVARAAGMHVVVLRKRFKAAYGLSPHEYLQRVRLADAMRMLADGGHNVRSALYASGWRSAKSPYQAAVAVTGMTLEQLRALPRDEWERRISIPGARLTAVA
jgi:AraC-like DNA-binding protein